MARDVLEVDEFGGFEIWGSCERGAMVACRSGDVQVMICRMISSGRYIIAISGGEGLKG
jgi:hypothetical protein